MDAEAGNEAAYLRDELIGLGHAPIDFVGTSDAAWSNAMSAVDVLVVPELEDVGSDLAASLSAATKSALESFVVGGGTLIVLGSGIGGADDLLNDVFGYSVVTPFGWETDETSGRAGLDAAAAAGTPFANAPDQLVNLNLVFNMDPASLPSNARAIYLTGSDATPVWTSAEGGGRVVYLGYDCWSGRNAEWAGVLQMAIPEPSTALLLASGLIGLSLPRR